MTDRKTGLRDDIRTTILDSITEGVFTIDSGFRITSFNTAAERITGTPRVQAVGRPCREILRASICEGRCALEQTMRSGKPVIGKNVSILDAGGNRRSISVTTALLRDSDDRIIGGVETFRDLSTIEQLRKEIEKEYTFEDILSRSHLMKRLFDILPDVAESGSTVLLEGESGTGKELVARAIHALSRRRRRAFVPVNCAALPDTLLESELFGYKAGAFTDARRDTPGRIARAEGGTLFLDEIGDISSALQVRLLRFLQERTYEPLGAMEPTAADVRIIAATNRHLPDRVRDGAFREDLFYRINVVCLTLPPLRDRMEDIPLLASHFIARLNRLQGREVTGIGEDAMACLMSYRFPGNVRELENVLERAFVLCRSGEIERHHLPESLCGPPSAQAGLPQRYRSFRRMEEAFLRGALERNRWNRRKTAMELGIHKTTLFRKMKALGIQQAKQEVRTPKMTRGTRALKLHSRNSGTTE